MFQPGNWQKGETTKITTWRVVERQSASSPNWPRGFKLLGLCGKVAAGLTARLVFPGSAQLHYFV